MSDEASGPDSEDDTYESKAAWKKDMASLAGVAQDALDKIAIFEVITPDWRADMVCRSEYA